MGLREEEEEDGEGEEVFITWQFISIAAETESRKTHPRPLTTTTTKSIMAGGRDRGKDTGSLPLCHRHNRKRSARRNGGSWGLRIAKRENQQPNSRCQMF